MRLWIAAVLLLVTSLVSAQNQPVVPIERLGLMLLANNQVKQELKLSKKTGDAIDADFKAFTAKAQELFKGVKDEAGQKKAMNSLRTYQDQIAKKVLSQLTAAQVARLRQLVMQSQGVWITMHPDISKALKLTTAQMEKIRAIRAAAEAKVAALEKSRRAELAKIPQPKQTSPKSEIEAYQKAVAAKVKEFSAADQKQLALWSKAAEKDALAVLTAAQRQQWTKMQGPVFKPKK